MIFTDNYNHTGRQPENLPQNRVPRQDPPTVNRNGNGNPGGRAASVNPNAGNPAVRRTQVPQNPQVSQPPVRRKISEDGLMRTKTTDISAISHSGSHTPVKSVPVKNTAAPSSASSSAAGRQKKKKEKRYPGSDEGGNTVVSVIKAVIYIIFVLVVSAFLSLTVITVANDVYAFVKSDEVVEVTIPEYATLEEVSEILYKNDIIKYPTIFKLYAVAENDDGEFLAGTYSVTPMMNYDTLLGEFKEKPVSGTATITIPEGYSTDEIINLMVSNGIGTKEGYVDVIQNYDFDYWFIDELEASGRTSNRLYRLDGYLFPDTYEFYKSSSEETVINKLLKRFSQIFTQEYRDQCTALGYSVDEMITLASMIEKEAASPSEFFLVSSVFHNRLNNPWSFPRLESDATVLYVIAHDKGERPKTVTPEDLQYSTPYNTYLYEGLPPGPIANPSASAMLAALSPVSTDYYYFYYMSSRGRTVYSATKSEHDSYIAQDKQSTQQTTGDVPESTP